MALLAGRIVRAVMMLTILTGCAQKVLLPSGHWTQRVYDITSSNLWSVQIVQGNEEKFAGVLVLQQDNEVLNLVLLDPTGIKLLEGEIYKNGEINISNAIAAMKQSRLPKYLGVAMRRIFYLHPDETSCDNKFVRFCWSIFEHDFMVKKATVGPFLRWSVGYLNGEKQTDQPFMIQYRSPWSDTSLFLQSIEEM